MLKSHGGEYPYRMIELYRAIGLQESNYSRWVKSNLLYMFYEDDDYILLIKNKSEIQKRNIRRDYCLKRRTAEELALLSKTKKGKQLRKWLLDLKEAVDTYDYLRLEQVYFLIDLVKVFSFVVNQKAAEKAHIETYIETFKDNKGKLSMTRICQQFHFERNKALNISPETIQERIKRFYDEENRLVNKTRKRDILAVIDKFSLVENAAFDFMSSIHKPSETALKVGRIVKEMATRMDLEIRPKNERDLFNEKIDLNPIITQRIRPYLPEQKNKLIS